MTCTCGHVDDEHASGFRECEIEDCPCIYFEESDEGNQ